MHDQETLDIENSRLLFLNLLNTYAPIKSKYSSANHANFVTKEPSNAILFRSKLRNKFLKEKTNDKKQRNLCVFLLKKNERNYYGNLDLYVVNCKLLQNS